MSMNDGAVCLLQPLGLLGIRGPDTLPFLQGQLSNDVTALHTASDAVPGDSAVAAPRQLLRAGLHNPQGRTLALLGLVATGADRVLALLPRELVGPTRATLQRYVLRSKVSLHDESDTHRIYGLTGRLAGPATAGADGVGGSGAATGSGIAILHEGSRQLRIVGAADLAPQGEPLSFSAWHAADIAAGLPQVYAATSGQFVAQMLNLDCIGAISFTKGCYTGQEVIARAHYRGRVKRRMHRYISREPLQLAPGDSGEFSTGGSFRVVDSVQQPDGRCEFLAVVAGSAADIAPGASDAPHPADTPAAAATAPPASALRIDALALPLPYPLPA